MLSMIPYGKIIPWIGYPIAAIIFGLWLQGRDNLAEQKVLCDAEKIEFARSAENLAREQLAAAYQQRMTELKQMAERAEGLAADAMAKKIAAEQKSQEAQRLIDEMSRSIEDAEDLPVERVCLVTDVPSVILDSLR